MKIKFDMSSNLTIYRILLEKAINDIIKRIHESVDDITWIIFNEETYANKEKDGYFKINIPSFLPKMNYKYGFCYIGKNEIWISTAAIQTYSQNFSALRGIPNLVEKKKVLLVNVILDELVHIKTGKDHGSTEYDNLLNKYYDLYYK